MAFTCELTLGSSIGSEDEIAFGEWLSNVWGGDTGWGKIVDGGTAYASATCNGTRGKICTTFRVALMDKGELDSGEKIERTTILAKGAAEGDEIPYGKPYSMFIPDA